MVCPIIAVCRLPPKSTRPSIADIPIEVAPCRLPDTFGVQDHDCDLHLVGELDGGTERIGRQLAAVWSSVSRPLLALAGKSRRRPPDRLLLQGERDRIRLISSTCSNRFFAMTETS